MAKVDSNDSLIHLWKIWRFVGAYPYAKLKFLYIIYAILITFVTDVLSPLFVVINIIFLTDLASIMRNLQISPTLIVASLKQFVVFFRMSDLRNAKLYLNKLDERANPNKEEIDYLRKVIKQCQLMAKTVQIVLFFSMSSYTIPAILRRSLVFEGWLPFDWTFSTTNYIMAFSFQFFTTAFQCVQNAANDAYPPIYIYLLIGHIRVLGIRVGRIGKDPKTTSEENYNELKSCIKDHKNIIRLFETIKPIISEAVLIQYIITASVMCVAVIYYLQFNRELSQLFTTLFYVSFILAEVFPVCYFGNALMCETDGLTTAIYNCNWMDQSVKFRKAIIIFMQRSQKTNVIIAGGMATISLQTFLSIVQFSFSMFTVLDQIG